MLKCCTMLLAGLLLTISFFYDVPDIDECESGIHNCLPDFICQNTLGSFRCRPKLQCKSGFIQDALGNCIGKVPPPGGGVCQVEPARWGLPGGAHDPVMRPPRTWGCCTVYRTEVGELWASGSLLYLFPSAGPA